MKRTRYALLVALGVLVVAFAAPAQAGGVDVSFGAAVQLNDRTDLFFSISSQYFDRDRDTVGAWGARYHDPDDLAVALFINHRSGRSLEELYALRQQRGLTWWEISVRCGVPADVWFVPVERDPGPPYGRAYGHWKKHRHDHSRVSFTDEDLRNLVAVRMMHEYYGVPVETAMQWRSGGRNVQDLMADEYEKRHGKPYRASRVAAGKDSPRGDRDSQGHKSKKKKDK